MVDRAQIAASVADSLRLEGLEPTTSALALAEAWVCGEASDDDLREAERRILAAEPIDDLPAPPAAADAPQAA